ncbi:membrane protein YczE [Cellulomonas palmilytica]|uniref:membrane protein YczE n=1 Tax=Cellulomonas palmilytica TaxID=2608402 RepID=UPI001F3EB5EF|nr:hypothetical protein [Cellulomonas palmilytica]
MIPAPAGRRLVRLAVGLVLYSVSIAMLVDAGLGNMPWDVLSQGVARRTGASFGTVTLAISALVLACWIPLRQRPGFGTIANVLVIGVLVDPFLALLDGVGDLGLGWRVLVAAAGIALNGLATALYVGAGLGPGPRDGLMTGLVARTGWSVAVVRTSIEVVVVVTGMLLGGRFGVATIAYALLVGPLVHVLLPRLRVEAPTVDVVVVDARDEAGPTVDHDDRPDRARAPEVS